MSAGNLTVWPSRAQRAILAAAPVKPDWPTEEAYRAGAARLDLEVNILKAFAKVEAGAEGAFLETGEPLLLFERHHFHRHTGGRFDGATAPDLLPASVALLSSPKPGGYGSTRIQHRKLQAAAKLDRVAALKSASWGLFQILGSNHARAGHQSLQRFINAMYTSADDHLAALVCFIESDPRLHKALRAKAWTPVAELYNGRLQKGYDRKFAAAYAELMAA